MDKTGITHPEHNPTKMRQRKIKGRCQITWRIWKANIFKGKLWKRNKCVAARSAVKKASAYTNIISAWLDWAHPPRSVLTCRLISRALSLRLNKQTNTQDDCSCSSRTIPQPSVYGFFCVSYSLFTGRIVFLSFLHGRPIRLSPAPVIVYQRWWNTVEHCRRWGALRVDGRAASPMMNCS